MVYGNKARYERRINKDGHPLWPHTYRLISYRYHYRWHKMNFHNSRSISERAGEGLLKDSLANPRSFPNDPRTSSDPFRPFDDLSYTKARTGYSCTRRLLSSNPRQSVSEPTIIEVWHLPSRNGILWFRKHFFSPLLFALHNVTSVRLLTLLRLALNSSPRYNHSDL